MSKKREETKDFHLVMSKNDDQMLQAISNYLNIIDPAKKQKHSKSSLINEGIGYIIDRYMKQYPELLNLINSK